VAWIPSRTRNGNGADRRASGQTLDRGSDPLVDIGSDPDRRQVIADTQSFDPIGAFTFDRGGEPQGDRYQVSVRLVRLVAVLEQRRTIGRGHDPVPARLGEIDLTGGGP